MVTPSRPMSNASSYMEPLGHRGKFGCIMASSQRVHVSAWYVHGPQSKDIGTTLGPRCIPYLYMDPLGLMSWQDNGPFSAVSELFASSELARERRLHRHPSQG